MNETKIINGMYFHPETPDAVCNILSNYRANGKRLRLHFGDTDTGRDWMEEHDIIGYIGQSTGTIKIPLLIANSRSMGGGGILDNCIVKITAGNQTLYKHPTYNAPTTEQINNQVFVGGNLYANCKDEQSARRLAEYLAGTRNAK